MPKKKNSKFGIISLRQLAKSADMDYNRLYNNLNGRYTSLTDSERIDLCNVLYGELRELSEFLQVDIILKKRN